MDGVLKSGPWLTVPRSTRRSAPPFSGRYPLDTEVSRARFQRYYARAVLTLWDRGTYEWLRPEDPGADVGVRCLKLRFSWTQDRRRVCPCFAQPAKGKTGCDKKKDFARPRAGPESDTRSVLKSGRYFFDRKAQLRPKCQHRWSHASDTRQRGAFGQRLALRG